MYACVQLRYTKIKVGYTPKLNLPFTYACMHASMHVYFYYLYMYVCICACVPACVYVCVQYIAVHNLQIYNEAKNATPLNINPSPTSRNQSR